MGHDGQDACHGDSSEPIIIYTSYGDVALLGVTSFGRGCELTDIRGVCANASVGAAASIRSHATWTGVQMPRFSGNSLLPSSFFLTTPAPVPKNSTMPTTSDSNECDSDHGFDISNPSSRTVTTYTENHSGSTSSGGTSQFTILPRDLAPGVQKSARCA